MKNAKVIFWVLGLGGAAWAGWEGYQMVASTLAKSADQTDKRRVAVLGFSSETGKTSKSSIIVTERLTSEIASNPRMRVIERSRLDEVLREQKLAAKGVVDPLTAKKIGSILGADAVVTGTVIELDDKNVEVNARLVDTQSAQIIKAVSKTIKKDWEDKKDAWKDFDFAMDIDLDAPVALLPPGFIEDETCRRLSDSETDLVKMCVTLKAKDTALKLKTGAIKITELTKNPGAEIKDTALKNLYYSKIKEWYYAKDLQPLTPQEQDLLGDWVHMMERYPCR